MDLLDAAKSDKPVEEASVVEGAKEEVVKEEVPPVEVEEAGEKKEEHQVPLHHLLNERHQKQELKSELDKLREEMNELKSKVNPPPEYDEDPKEYFEARLKQIEEKLDGAKVTEESVEEKIAVSRIQDALTADEAQAKQKHPDVISAINYVRKYFENQHKLSGIPVDQIPGIIGQAEMNFARDILSQGGSPHDAIYEHAMTLGYKPDKVAPDPKIESIKKGKESSTPMSGGDAGGTTTSSEPDAFDEAFKKAFTY